MKKLFLHFFIFFMGSLLCFSNSAAIAQPPEQVYQTGKNAFDKNDYLVAAKHLFAYQKLMNGNIDQSMNNQINSAVQYCDEQISLAIRTKEELDKYGHITEVIIDASGSADTAVPQKETKEFHQPQSPYRPKPPLPSSAPGKQPAEIQFYHVIKPLAVAPPLEKAEQVESKKDTEKLEKQIANLKNENILLQKQVSEQRESFQALKRKYSQLLSRYKALRDQQ